MRGLLFSYLLPLLASAQSAPSATSVSGHPIIELQGRVLHPHGRTFKLSDNYGNLILDTQLEPDGRFHFRARWGTAQPATLRIGEEETELWMTPGDNLTLTLDARHFDETLHYAGYGARVNNFRAAELLASKRRTCAYERTLPGTQAQFRVWLVADRRRSLARLTTALPHPTASEQAFATFQRSDLYFLLYQNMERNWPSDHLVRAGLPAPALRAYTPAGLPFTLSQLRGKVVFVDFWASWCSFCIVEDTYATQLRTALADHANEVAFVCISIDESLDKWQCAREHYQPTSLHVWSPDSVRQSAADLYQLPSIPRYVLIGRDGRILDGNAPYPSSGRVEALIRKALAPPVAARVKQRK